MKKEEAEKKVEELKKIKCFCPLIKEICQDNCICFCEAHVCFDENAINKSTEDSYYAKPNICLNAMFWGRGN